MIVFHVIDEAGQEQCVKNMQFCVVGNYLCHRRRDNQIIWVTKIKQNEGDSLQESNKDDLEAALTYKEYASVALSIDKMTRKIWIEHI